MPPKILGLVTTAAIVMHGGRHMVLFTDREKNQAQRSKRKGVYNLMLPHLRISHRRSNIEYRNMGPCIASVINPGSFTVLRLSIPKKGLGLGVRGGGEGAQDHHHPHLAVHVSDNRGRRQRRRNLAGTVRRKKSVMNIMSRMGRGRARGQRAPRSISSSPDEPLDIFATNR